jgi:hypothetical protein
MGTRVRSLLARCHRCACARQLRGIPGGFPTSAWWSGQLGALRRQELGCAVVLNFSSLATITDGRVLFANGTDLWIRG